MESEIKKDDTVEVTAGFEEMKLIGISLKTAHNLKSNKHKVSARHGRYAVISGYTLPTRFLKKCEK